MNMFVCTINKMYSVKISSNKTCLLVAHNVRPHLVTVTPAWLSTPTHSSLLSFPSPSRSAARNIFLTFSECCYIMMQLTATVLLSCIAPINHSRPLILTQLRRQITPHVHTDNPRNTHLLLPGLLLPGADAVKPVIVTGHPPDTPDTGVTWWWCSRSDHTEVSGQCSGRRVIKEWWLGPRPQRLGWLDYKDIKQA